MQPLEKSVESTERSRLGRTQHSDYDLEFVAIEDESEGGWYRELPDASIEVMSHARLQRVPLGDSEPEQKAREVVADIIKDQKNSI